MSRSSSDREGRRESMAPMGITVAMALDELNELKNGVWPYLHG